MKIESPINVPCSSSIMSNVILTRALKGELSLTLVLPGEIATELSIVKGDFLKCVIDGKKLIVQKVDL
jgi:hypothetical protein